MAAGLIDADLGGSVYKKRVAMAAEESGVEPAPSWAAILEIDGFSYFREKRSRYG
jgi:hypothetical protein